MLRLLPLAVNPTLLWEMQMNKSIALSIAALGLLTSVSAAADIIGFTDGFAPGLWMVNFTGTLITPGGSLGSVTETPSTFTIVGGNGTSPNPPAFVPDCNGGTYGLIGPCEVDVFRSPIAPSNSFSFHWAYTTGDSGGPAGDIFGLLVNGVRIPLSNPGGPISQSGNVTIAANSSFGWFINCTDCIQGTATATITNFVAATVPEPASLALLGIGFASLLGMRRRVA